MKHNILTHEFVEHVPAELADGVLYISITYRTAVHRCACGCGNKVVTPITPADWQLLYDGDTVSLTPSIGNWGFPCRSHYWIDAGQIRPVLRPARRRYERAVGKPRPHSQVQAPPAIIGSSAHGAAEEKFGQWRPLKGGHAMN